MTKAAVVLIIPKQFLVDQWNGHICFCYCCSHN